MTGMPTPTSSPCSGATEGKVCSSRVSGTVVNREVWRTVSPSSPLATVRMEYAAPGSRPSVENQPLLSAEISPARSPASDVTDTLVRVPSATAISIVLSTGTSVAPGSTLAVTTAAGTSGSSSAPALELVLGSSSELPGSAEPASQAASAKQARTSAVALAVWRACRSRMVITPVRSSLGAAAWPDGRLIQGNR